jgi:hypothetical protein
VHASGRLGLGLFFPLSHLSPSLCLIIPIFFLSPQFSLSLLSPLFLSIYLSICLYICLTLALSHTHSFCFSLTSYTSLPLPLLLLPSPPSPHSLSPLSESQELEHHGVHGVTNTTLLRFCDDDFAPPQAARETLLAVRE